MSRNNCHTKIKYVYELPFTERQELCRILKQNDKWEELAGDYMKYDVSTIRLLRKRENPTDELLTMWGHYNHTIKELFVLLLRMQHIQSLKPLKKFVDPKYHESIDNGEGIAPNILRMGQQNPNTNDSKIGAQNFNQPGPAQVINSKGIVDPKNRKESTKILNRSPSDTPLSNSDNLLVPSPSPTPVASPVLQPVASTSKKPNDIPFIDSDTALPQVEYNELERATCSWSKHNILGKGGFGTVFRGKWKNTEVAVKRIEQRGPDTNDNYIVQLQQSLRELKILNARRHDNILSLYAYSMGGESPCLVYQFMPNGSLEDRLLQRQKTKPLNWLQRHEIAKGTARGLQFLHTIGDKPLIHGDIKSANILLDKHFEPRIGDFGLAREGPEKDNMKVSRIHGTRPYLPEDFLLEKNLSTKIDTYSYGIVLFELATGLAAYDHNRPGIKFLKDFMETWEGKDLSLLIDKKAGPEHKQVYDNLIVLGKWCSNRLSKDRPEMVQVFRKLEDL